MFTALGPNQKYLTSSCGFSLMELLVALFLMALVMFTAVPSLVETKASFDRRNAEQSLEFDLRRARSEALSRGVRIIITLASDGKSYTVGEDLLPYDTTTGVHDSLLFTTILPQNVTLSFSGSGAEATKTIYSSRGFLSDIGGNRDTSQKVMALYYQGDEFVTATIYPVGVAAFSTSN